MNPNPKQAAGAAKPRLDLLEYAANMRIAEAMADGARKYGAGNFRISGPILARTYGAAMERHIGLYLSGEDYAPDSGIHHLAHAAACVHVVFAAMEAGTFEDDRGPVVLTPPPPRQRGIARLLAWWRR